MRSLLNERGFGQLSSRVFYFDVTDSASARVTTFNGSSMLINVAYKGTKTNVNDINVVTANWAADKIEALPSSNILAIVPATDSADGLVIFKTTELGYFVITDK